MAIIRDNDVYIRLMTDILSEHKYEVVRGTFNVTDCKITKGQPSDVNVGSVLVCGTDGRFRFRVGRKGSNEVAAWFNRQVDTVNNTTFGHTAGKLNFAFKGDLELTLKGGLIGNQAKVFIFKDIVIAQGKSGLSNNWWFGGRYCFYMGSNSVNTSTSNNFYKQPAKFVFTRGCNGVNKIAFYPLSLYGDSKWMASLDPATTLNNIVLPGSHDSGMSELHHKFPAGIGAVGPTKTQALSVRNQLNCGARYFDLRIDYDHNALVTYHRSGGMGANGQDLNVILDQARSFLIANPSEFVILKFSHIRDYKDHHPLDTKRRINVLLNNYADVIYKNPMPSINLASLKLSDVRGKIILVFDYNEYISTLTGRFRYFDYKGAYAANLTVYDQYSNTSNYETMKNNQIQKWNEFGGLGKDYLFLLSWTLTAGALGSVKHLASTANLHLFSVLNNQIKSKHIKPNIVYVDFVNAPLMQDIIYFNFN